MRVLDFFFALRPLVLVPAWSFFVLGWAAAGGAPFPWLRFALLSLVLCGAYLVNQIVDLETDRINGKGFFLQRGIFTPRFYAWAATLFIAASCGIAFVLDASPRAIAVAAALGLAYSMPPLRLAARPGLDLAANAAGYGIVAPWIGAGDALPPARLLAAAALAVAAVFLHTTLLDLEGDRRTGKRTSGTVLGLRGARAGALLCSLAAVALAHGSAPQPQWIATCVLAPLTAAAMVLPHPSGSRLVCVAGTAAFALAAAFLQPIFGAAVVVLVLATRVYYRQRFALAYPAL
jgi:chlorophyll synthase